MKTILSGLSDAKAQKEFRLFAIAGFTVSVLGLIAFWWLGFGGVALSSRGVLLSWHRINRSGSRNMVLRLIAAVGLGLGAVSMLYGLSGW